MPLLISILSFVVLMLIFSMWYNDYMADKITVKERAEKYLKERPDMQNWQNVQNNIITVPSTKFWRRSVESLSVPFERTYWAEKLDHQLVKADLPFRGSEFIIISLGIMLFVMVLFMFLSGGSALMGIIGFVSAYILIYFFVLSKIKRRVKAFNAQLADALVLMASSLRSGYSFMQAIEMLSREMQPPLSEEFYRVLREINLGVTTDEAMNHMADRINSEDLDLVVTAVLIQRQVGGNLTEILDNIAYTIRERVKIKGHIRTLTAQGRLSGLIIGLLPIVVGWIVYLINPAYIYPLISAPIGNAMLGFAIFIEIIGAMFIRKIVNINV